MTVASKAREQERNAKRVQGTPSLIPLKCYRVAGGVQARRKSGGGAGIGQGGSRGGGDVCDTAGKQPLGIHNAKSMASDKQRCAIGPHFLASYWSAMRTGK